MSLNRFAVFTLATLAFVSQSNATPDLFGSNQQECEEYVIDKFEADLSYIQQELFDDSTLINAARDVHEIEMRACQGMLSWG